MEHKNDNMFWDSFAGKYDAFISKYANTTYLKSLELINEELNEHVEVLEIGTGTGLVSCAIADKVKSIKAIDFAPEMINIAQKKIQQSGITNIEFMIGTATDIDFPDKFFNIIIASNVFHLLSEPNKALQEIVRLLADNGKAILPTYCHGQNFKTRIISGIMGLSGFKAKNKWSVNSFRKFIENEGLEVKKEVIIKDKIPLSFIVASRSWQFQD